MVAGRLMGLLSDGAAIRREPSPLVGVGTDLARTLRSAIIVA